jgi:hypothetical protein
MSEQEQLKEHIRKFRADPSLFVEKVLGVPREIQIVNGKPFGQTEQQKQLLMAVAKPGAKVSAKAGHGVGKSTVDAWLVLWFLCCYKDVKVPCTAPSGHQLEDVLWAEIAKWHDKMHPWFKQSIKVKSDRVEVVGIEKNQFAVARTARRENPDALQGFHADNLLFLIDEAAGVDEKVFEVARGALSTPSARVVMTANPTRTTGYFYQSHHLNRDHWTRLTFSCLDSPLVDPSYAQEIAAEYGEDSDMYRVRVLGEFPNASIMQLIPNDLVERAMKANPREDMYINAPVVLGVDVSYFGDDRCSIFKRQGLASWLLLESKNMDTTQLATAVARFEDEHNADVVNIDLTGWGAGVVDAGRSWNRNWNGIMVGGASGDPACYNKRAECWWKGLQWLKDGGSLPQNTDLRDDLVGPQYFYSRSTNKIQLERKEDMKKRGLASPDLGDGWALTFAVPVVGKGDGVYRGGSGRLHFSTAGDNPLMKHNDGRQFANANYSLFKRRR